MSSSTEFHLSLAGSACRDASRVGSKVANLATLSQAGAPVPPGFVVLCDTDLESGPSRAAVEEEAAKLLERGPVAVRSSSTAEDLVTASGAGQHESILGVGTVDGVLDAITRVRDSLRSRGATAYRQHMRIEHVEMAVLVQRQVDVKAAGAAFGIDPLTGADEVVLEAVAGLGEPLMHGDADPQSWRIGDGRILSRPETPIIADDVALAVAGLTRQAGDAFAKPQDIEWAWDGCSVWLLQSRPITTGTQTDFFSEFDAEPDRLWTAGFLNERFTKPVSPLGWTLVADPLSELALRGPLRLLAAEDLEGPLLRLVRGHPYTRVEAWSRIYRLFPDRLLPEDAARFFPAGDASTRKRAAVPAWGFRLLGRLLHGHWRERHVAGPIRNQAAWRRFEGKLDDWLATVRPVEASLTELADDAAASTIRRLMNEGRMLTFELLTIHRWSLFHADMLFSLLRKRLRFRHGRAEGTRRAAELTMGLSTKTAEMNRAFRALAEAGQARTDVAAVLADAASYEELSTRLGRHDPFVSKLQAFLGAYGRRFFSLDLADPPYEVDPIRVFALLCRGPGQGEYDSESAPTNSAESEPRNSDRWRPWIRLTKRYLALREDQRFAWQGILALQRRLALALGHRLCATGILSTPEHVFGLTFDELLAGSCDRASGESAATRCARLAELRREHELDPAWHYPAFLRGNRALETASAQGDLRGRPVSPGMARGRACVVTGPEQFDRVRVGDVLVTAAADPGWTPLFDTIAALVTEHGGQLSHAAVVAREYRLPAVAGIPGLLATVRNGEPLFVDGTEGIVRRLDASPVTDADRGTGSKRK